MVNENRESNFRITQIGISKNINMETYVIKFDLNGLSYVLTPEAWNSVFKIELKNGESLLIAPCGEKEIIVR